MYKEHYTGLVGNSPSKQHKVGFKWLNSSNVPVATPEEIAEAKEEGKCPRCENTIDTNLEGGYCHECSFTY